MFRGIIKDLRVNGDIIDLNGIEQGGNAAVYPCDSQEVMVPSLGGRERGREQGAGNGEQ